MLVGAGPAFSHRWNSPPGTAAATPSRPFIAPTASSFATSTTLSSTSDAVVGKKVEDVRALVKQIAEVVERGHPIRIGAADWQLP
jgi:hypothetical protein